MSAILFILSESLGKDIGIVNTIPGFELISPISSVNDIFQRTNLDAITEAKVPYP